MAASRRWQLVRRAIAGIGLAIVLVLVGAASYEQLAAWRDRRAFGRVGRPVDIGGRTLNIQCLGDGSPTVVFESGRGAPGYVWTPSQRAISGITRACWYDRAGLGWSDQGPDPAWGDAAARDLHVLLRNAGVAPPLVLVGHSFGGYIIRLYHDAHPGAVAGMVFVDAAHEDAGSIAGMPRRQRPPIPRPVIRGLSVAFGYLGLPRFFARDSGPAPAGWTSTEWATLTSLQRQRMRLLTDAQSGPERATAALVRGTGGLEQMPMVVLTQGRMPPDPHSIDAQVVRGWMDLQRSFAQRSARGRQVVVSNAGHGIPLEAPGAIIDAVRDVITIVRGDR